MENTDPDCASVSAKACELILHYGVGKPREAAPTLADFSDDELLAEVNRRERLAANPARASDSELAAGTPDT